MAERPRRKIGSAIYWSVAVVFTVFGFVDLIAIGAPFLAVGVAMLVFGPWRDDRAVFIPGLTATFALVGTFLLVAPWTCEEGSGLDAVTICHHAFGITYHGQESLRPALVVSVIVAVGTWFLARRITRKRGTPIATSA
jgi:hypothetical protein